MELDESVDGLGAAVGGAAGVEVAQERGASLPQRLAEPGDLGDWAGVKRVQDPFCDGAAGEVGVPVVGRAELLGAPVGEFDLDVLLPGGERRLEPGLLPVGEPLSSPARRMFRTR